MASQGGGNECARWASWFGDPEYEVDAMTVRTILQEKITYIHHSTVSGQRVDGSFILVSSGIGVDTRCWCC